MTSSLYRIVMCVETGELLYGLPADADTARMRANRTYVHVCDEPEFVVPCAGAGTQVSAYWRGHRGNKVRAQELVRQRRANNPHSV